MTLHFRHSPFIGLCLLSVGACASTERPPASVRATPAAPVHSLVNWVPSNAVSALYINYAQLKGDWKAVLDAGDPPDARRVQQGFVESEDVDHAVLCALGEGATPENLTLYDGRFGRERLEKSQIAAGGDLPNYRDIPMWGVNDRALAAFNRTRVGVGARTALQGAIDAKDGAAEPLSRERWYAEAIEKMALHWPSSRRVGLELTARSTGPMRDKLSSWFPEASGLRWFSARAGGSDDFDLVAIGKAESPEAAQALVFALAQKAEQWAGRPQVRFMGLSGVLEAVRFDNEGAFAKAQLHIKADEWRGLKQRFSELLAFIRKRQAQSSPAPPSDQPR